MAVGDRQGLSFYHNDRIGRLLKIDLAALGKARRRLMAKSLEYFLSAHIQDFHFLQGVPKKIRYDNLKSVVLGRFGQAVQFNPRFLDFARFYSFDPSLCNPQAPYEKGRVDRAARPPSHAPPNK